MTNTQLAAIFADAAATAAPPEHNPWMQPAGQQMPPLSPAEWAAEVAVARAFGALSAAFGRAAEKEKTDG